MKRKLLPLITVLAMLAFNVKINAQSSLIHFWNFNNFTSVEYTDTIHGIDADYSTLDTAKAQILYTEIPGTSPSYVTYEDFITPASGAPDYDTVNAMGYTSGNALRTRNPSDSMWLLFYIPSTNYTHILLTYGCESTTSGMHSQQYSYSVDSGLTWRTSGLSVTSDTIAIGFFGRVSVSIAGDSDVKNNDKLVFRVIFGTNDTGTHGNDRFDNVSVQGDSIEPASISITAAPSGSICSGTSVHFSATSAYTNVVPYYHWYVNSVSAGTDSTGFTTTLLTPGSLVKCVMTDSVDGSVLAISNVITMTVNPTPVPGTISGSSNVCPLTSISLSETSSGGTWSASNATATINTAGVVTGVTSGIDTITYHVTTVCGSANATFIVTIANSPSPGIISGSSAICTSTNDTLSETASGGVWSSSNAHAIISAASGIVSAITAGADTIIYTVTTSCGTSHASYPVSLIAGPVAGSISGAASVCMDSMTTLTETVTGGTWSSSNSNADVSTGGAVLGVTGGSATISYSITNICGSVIDTQAITINTVVDAGTITGPDTVCVGRTVSLSDAATGGMWLARNTKASVTLTGVVTGAYVGVDTIVYSFVNPCGISGAIHIISIRPASACLTGVIALSKSAGMLQAYPNPARSNFTVYCTSPDNETADITISNIVGEKVKVLSIATNQPYEVSLDQPSGIYFINAITSHGNYITKIILAH